jgi:1-acyl-sn-glycerol-3-phosphate acyltransferase
MDLSGSLYRRARAGFQWLSRYHDYEVFGLEHVPREGATLMVANHTLATYDSFLLGVHILDHLGRTPRVLADRTIFRTPVLGRVCTELGFVNGTRENAMRLLREGELVGTAPGGMREGLRSSKEKYRFDWTGRLGFVWMSMLTGTPIVLTACPAGDDLFDVADISLTPWVYERFHFPMPFFRGHRGLPVPRPIKLWHLLSEPILPEVPSDRVQRSDVEAHHRRIVLRMERLMADAVERLRAM